MTSIAYKVTLVRKEGNELRRFHGDFDYDGLQYALAHLWGVTSPTRHSLLIQYVDDEGDKIHVTSNVELQECLRLHADTGAAVLKLEVRKGGNKKDAAPAAAVSPTMGTPTTSQEYVTATAPPAIAPVIPTTANADESVVEQQQPQRSCDYEHEDTHDVALAEAQLLADAAAAEFDFLADFPTDAPSPQSRSQWQPPCGNVPMGFSNGATDRGTAPAARSRSEWQPQDPKTINGNLYVRGVPRPRSDKIVQLLTLVYPTIKMELLIFMNLQPFRGVVLSLGGSNTNGDAEIEVDLLMLKALVVSKVTDSKTHNTHREMLTILKVAEEIYDDDCAVQLNIALLTSILNQTDDALVALHCAVDLGFSDLELLTNSTDLNNVRLHPGFGDVVKRAQEAVDHALAQSMAGESLPYSAAAVPGTATRNTTAAAPKKKLTKKQQSQVIGQVQSMFPSMTPQDIRPILVASNNDVERCVEAILANMHY